MKRVIHHIFECKSLAAHTIVANGVGGTIQIEFHLPEIVHISYLFEGVPLDPDLQHARSYMTAPLATQTCEIPVGLGEEQELFRLQCGPTVVTIEKVHGLISIYYCGVLQHGGSLGNADTVIPDYQLRCIDKLCEGTSFGRFNFPLLPSDAFYGLGDKTGLPNRRGRRYSMFNRDALGYDASNSDPLYKSIPFFIRSNPQEGVTCGLFFDHPHVDCIDLGRESPFYYSVETNGNLYSYFALLGSDYKEVLNHYYAVTGFPSLPPLFSFGFFGSSMNYVEPDDAPQRILSYFDTIEKHHIPCEGMYVSSGYLKAADGKRYAFLWNKEKFPDHRAFLNSLAKRGYNLCMNIKPGILTTHPWYQELKQKGFFIADGDGNPYMEFFWGGEASLIDFGNSEAADWWKQQLKAQYLDHGCTGIWNDNNEYEMEDTQLRAFPLRSLYPVKMVEASYQVFKERNPQQRPWIYTRSGYAGVQRFARTWSGDNVSDWKTLKYNQYMSVGFGLSGLPYFGHDLGGFFGAFPEEELLVRSCQSAVFQGRFVIHSWREDGIPTEPWSYPTALDAIKHLIQEHYRFLPYIYNCAIQASVSGAPLDRMLKLEFPKDPYISETEINTLFGDSVLKVVVTDPQVTELDVYLPASIDWYDGTKGSKHAGGVTVRVKTPCDGSHQWFAKAGCAIPTAPSQNHLTTAMFPQVDFLIFPSSVADCISWYYEDDGSTEHSLGLYSQWKITVGVGTVAFLKLKASAPQGHARQFRLLSGFASQGRVLAQFDPDSIMLGQTIAFTFSY